MTRCPAAAARDSVAPREATVAESGAAPVDPAGLPTGVVTYMFTDVEGSSALVESLGAAWPAVLERHDDTIGAAVRHHGGTVVNTEGDAVFAVFPAAPGAVAAAADAQRDIAAQDWPGTAPLRVRMGLHTGEGTRGGRDYAGLDVHRAARISAAGHGGQVLVSAATREDVEDALPDGVGLRDLGEHGLRGLTRPERLAQLVIEGLQEDFPAPRALRSLLGTLPSETDALVGRGREVAELTALVGGAQRITTVTGPGGTGKTRLSLAVGKAAVGAFPDGAAYVALAPVADPALVPSTIADALGVREEPGRPVLETLAARLAPLSVLLVLDNMEHLLDAAPAVARVAAAGAGVRVLVTSRAPLRLSGEQEYPLGPLGVPEGDASDPAALAANEAVALFVARARERDPGFALTAGNAAAVAAICRALDGLPLAIELAASRVQVMSPEEMLGRMDRRLPLLSGGARDRPERHRTLRAAIEWSHALLGEPARTMLRRLSVFAGDPPLDALEEVCGDVGADPLEVLTDLIDQSLLRRVDADVGRYRTLQVIREFAAERLEEAGEAPATRARHAAWYGRLAREAAPVLTAASSAAALERLERAHGDLRAAMDWAEQAGDAALGLGLAADLWRYWQIRNHTAEGRERLERMLALPGAEGAPRERARALDALGSVLYWQGRYRAAEGRYEQGLAAFRALGDARAELEARNNLAWVASAEGRWADARAAFAAVVDGWRDVGGTEGASGAGRALGAAGMVEHRDGDPALAVATIEEGLRALEGLDEPWWTANARAALGYALSDMGRTDEAMAPLILALDFYLAIRDRAALRFTLDYCSRVQAAAGRTSQAVVLAAGADALGRRLETYAPHAIVGTWDARATLAGRLPADEFARCWAEGETSGEAALVALARALA
jgi:predicted ATPase/class 3 adenylate cyclase